MEIINGIHQMLGYLMVVLLALELIWTLVEMLTDSDSGSISTVKSKSVVGLLHLQVLLGLVNSYLRAYFPTYHVIAMIGGAGTLHVSNKQSGWTRVLLQVVATFLVVLGIGFRHMFG